MTKDVAAKIATLINERNQLDRACDAARVLKHCTNYEYELEGEVVVTFVESKGIGINGNTSSLGESSAHTYRLWKSDDSKDRTKGKRRRCENRSVHISVGNVESESVSQTGLCPDDMLLHSRIHNYVAVWQKRVAM